MIQTLFSRMLRLMRTFDNTTAMDDEFGEVMQRIKLAYLAATDRVTNVEMLDADPQGFKFSADPEFCSWAAPHLRALGYQNKTADSRRFWPVAT